MNRKEHDKITSILNAVPDSYDDFVIGMRNSIMLHPEYEESIIKYIQQNPLYSSSDITEYYLKLVEPEAFNRLQNATLSL